MRFDLLGKPGSKTELETQMSYSLNSLKDVIWGTTIGDIKGDTRSLDHSSACLDRPSTERGRSSTPPGTQLVDRVAGLVVAGTPVRKALGLLLPMVRRK